MNNLFFGIKYIAFLGCLLAIPNLFGQCPETLLSENFNSDPIIGPILPNIYGDGNWNGAANTYDGSYYGWFNVRNGFSDVDVYDRETEGCLGSDILISLLMRRSFGTTDVDIIAVDDFGDELASTNILLTGVYTLYTLDFTLVTSENFRFIIHCNSTGGAGVDICVENLLILADDNEFPTATGPGPLFVECFDDIPAPDPSLIADEADNCSIPSVEFVSDVSNGEVCPEIITRTYAVSDDCDNTLNLTQTITVHDVTPPTASNPDPLFVECITDVPDPDSLVVIDEADNCDGPIRVEFVSDVSDGETCPETITRTYAVIDTCDNSINVTQTITVDDTTNPTASDPGDLYVAELEAPDPAVVTDEADNCGIPTVEFIEDISDGGYCPETVIRTYSVTDDCGNSIVVSQTIIVADDILPTASNPDPITVACPEDFPLPDVTVVTDEDDNMGTPVVTFVSDVSDGEVCNGEVITRTYAVTDDCGNVINVTQLITIEATTPIINAGIDISICEGETVVLTADNPDGATISWSDDIDDGVAFTPLLGTTEYTVTASVCSGICIATDAVSVTVNPNPVPAFNGDVLSGCTDHTVNFINASTYADVCQWNFGDGDLSTFCGPLSHTYTTPGLFDVTLIVTSDAGCESSLTITDYIEVYETPIALFSFTPSIVSQADNLVTFINSSLYADSYIWNFGDGSPENNEINPTHVFPVIDGESYTVVLEALTSNGCTDTVTGIINVKNQLIYYVPNTFTPDGDSFNDSFKPIITAGININDYHLAIFNRWGELIFESYDPNYGWNGTYGSTDLAPDGVYVWQIEFGEISTDKKHVDTGTITLMK